MRRNAPMTAVIRTFIAALSLTAPLFAQPEPTALPAAPTTPALDLTPPGPAESLDAFKAVEGWLHDWAVPDALHLRGLENAGAAGSQRERQRDSAKGVLGHCDTPCQHRIELRR